ncbi:alginate lyase-domain-containing protein [Mycena alexandri]|uniref:Alginate lyase-domain-containing protein n=1 Tax=Mycena alexandri TaxID=1745969 RepID=A0AAD6SQL4_9AGAR|nr:alginate lyase-domain-containing protein [Mycena alexandri]
MRYQSRLASSSSTRRLPRTPGPLFIEPGLNNGKCLTAASNADGAIVTIQTCTGSTAQTWTFTGGSVKIFGNTKCLDVTNGSTANGNKLQIWTCSTNNNPNQQFYYTSDKHFSWTNHGKCIDVTGGSTADGNRPQIWDCSGPNPNQIWNTSPSGSTSSSASSTKASSVSSTKASSTSSSATPSATPPASTVPNTVVIDSSRLVAAKAALVLGADPAYSRALAALTSQADGWLNQGPWTVTSKTVLGPGAGIHDYTSQAPYFFPSNTSNGCPYVEQDGVHNPQVDVYTDHANRASMFQSAYILSLAWYYTGKAQYATKAGQVLRTWFVDSATAQTPNLLHAQFIPCANTGRSIGIIDFSQQYTDLLDAAAILATGAPGWTSSDISGFQQWNVNYLNWLETSSFGMSETAATNNHGTFAIMQSAAIALFTGNTALATSKANLGKTRIASYISANGSQPQVRARPHSAASTTRHTTWLRIPDSPPSPSTSASILWGYKGPQGQSIFGAVDFIIPAATGASQWQYPDLNFTAFSASDVIHAAADAGDPKAVAAVGKVPTPPGGDLWLLRPAAEQLDALAS